MQKLEFGANVVPHSKLDPTQCTHFYTQNHQFQTFISPPLFFEITSNLKYS